MALAINDTAPDFEAQTTEGKIKFHDWIGDKWAVLFSHPKDFTPVCTTELGYMAKIKPEFDKRGVKIIGLSVDPVDKHAGWAADIKETQGFAPNYPMIGDVDFNVSKLYGMLPAAVSGDPAKRTAADNQTVRNVFIIGPDKKIKLILVYPMTVGRNFDEVLRVIDSLQLGAKHKVATPVNWKQRRRRDHRRLGHRRRRQEAVPAGLEVAEAVYPHRAAAEVAYARQSVLIIEGRGNHRALRAFGCRHEHHDRSRLHPPFCSGPERRPRAASAPARLGRRRERPAAARPRGSGPAARCCRRAARSTSTASRGSSAAATTASGTSRIFALARRNSPISLRARSRPIGFRSRSRSAIPTAPTSPGRCC